MPGPLICRHALYLKLELPPFRRHLIVWRKSPRHSQVVPPVSAKFRQQTVELVQAGRTPPEMAREFGCTAQSIVDRMGQAASDAGRPLPGTAC